MGAKGTTKNSGRKDEHDRFYTPPLEAERLLGAMAFLSPSAFDGTRLFIEPSAGAGAFVKACEGRDLPVIAYDLVPSPSPVCKAAIQKQDFLSLDKETIDADADAAGFSGYSEKIFIGNPPFGVQGDLSIRFVNHCFELGGSEVWFILPPTFRKESYLNKMPHAELSHVVELEECRYILPDGNTREVPSTFLCFSFTQEKPDPIPTDEYLARMPFEFVSKADAEFSIRRVGGTAGTAKRDTACSEQSNYFCRVKDGSSLTASEMISKVNDLEFPERDWTVGPRSISKRELAKRWCENLAKPDLE